MASNNYEIVTPKVLLATGDNISFMIFDAPIMDEDYHRSWDWDWYTSGLMVPVVANEHSFPFRVTSKTFEIPPFITVKIAKQRRVPIVTMMLGKFGSLPKLFCHGVLNIVICGHFGYYCFDHKMESIPVKANERDANAEVKVQDEFLENFYQKVGPGQHVGDFKIEMFWKFTFINDKLDYMDRILSLTTEMQHVEGTVGLLPNTGNMIKTSKGLLAASSPKFKAQFEQDPVSELIFTIDGQVVISEESLKAFQQFLYSFSLQQPLERCSTAMDLLMAAHYHMFGTLETIMQDILLAQHCNWFDLGTSIRLFSFATMVCSSYGDSSENEVWNNLKWKALRNMKSVSIEELQGCAGIGSVTLDPMEMLKMLSLVA